MSTPHETKTYVPRAACKEIKTKLGNSILKIGIHADTMIEFLRANANDRGYVNLCITPRKTEGKYGDTHCMWLDTWQPDANRPAPQPRQHDPRAKIDPADVPPPTDDADLPF